MALYKYIYLLNITEKNRPVKEKPTVTVIMVVLVVVVVVVRGVDHGGLRGSGPPENM